MNKIITFVFLCLLLPNCLAVDTKEEKPKPAQSVEELRLDLEKILKVFWHAHDPTSLNRQGADAGTQYRSAIFYSTDAQKKIAEKSKEEAGKEFSKPIVTEITKLDEFFAAENYHQDYYRLNKDKNPYCQRVIAPKLQKLGLKD